MGVTGEGEGTGLSLVGSVMSTAVIIWLQFRE